MAPSVVVNFNPHIVIATMLIFSQVIFQQKKLSKWMGKKFTYKTDPIRALWTRVKTDRTYQSWL